MRHLRLVQNERGMALPLAIIVVVALGSLVMAYLSMGRLEPQVSRNLTEATQVRYVAEAGLEFGLKRLLDTSANWTALLQTNNGELAAAGTLMVPGDATLGSYRVSIRNDVCAANSAVAGCPTNELADTVRTGMAALDAGDPAGATATDSNNVVILTSQATLGTATRTVSAVVRYNKLPTFNGALAFPGLQADVSFSGTSFDIWGRDTNLDGSAGAGAAVYGISVSPVYGSPPGNNENVVQNALTSAQRDKVWGKSEQNPGSLVTGNYAIQADADLTPESIANFIAAAKSAADITLESTQSNRLIMNSVGSTCGSNWASSSCWGTQANPKIVYVRGTPPDPTSSFRALELNGTTSGAGILIVEDGDIVINDNFRWDGPIIVTGKYVGIGFLGSSSESQQVFGGVISNETENEGAGFNEGVLTGNARIKYSTQGLALGQNLINAKLKKFVAPYSWREN